MLMPRDGAVSIDIPDDVRVVVAEDDRGTRLVLRGLLRSLGISEIIECANGAEAFVQIQRTAPDLLISDWEMPEVSGVALTRLVRNHPDSPNPLMPVIMLTSHSNQSLVARARDAGVTAFLAKPVSRKALAARLEAAVQRTRCYVLTRRFFGPDRRRGQQVKGVSAASVPQGYLEKSSEARNLLPTDDLDVASDAFMINPAPWPRHRACRRGWSARHRPQGGRSRACGQSASNWSPPTGAGWRWFGRGCLPPPTRNGWPAS